MPTREEMIRALEAKDAAPPAQPSREQMIAELEAVDPPQEKSTFQKVTDTIDSYTGAPTRAGLSKLLEGKPAAAITKFVRSMGEDPSHAPKGRDIAQQIGINDNPAELEKSIDEPSLKGLLYKAGLQSVMGPLAGALDRPIAQKLDENKVTNADLAGLPIEVAADWTNLLTLGGGKVAKFAQEGGKLVNLTKQAEEAAKLAKAASKAPQIIENGAELVPGSLPMVGEFADEAKNAIKLANEGGARTPEEIAKIKEAARAIGIEPTPGMLSNSPALRAAESSLDQSPSIGGMLVRNGKSGTTQFRKGLGAAVEKFGDAASEMSKVDVGNAVKSDIMETLKAKYEPIASKFETIRESTENIDLADKPKLIASRSILRQKAVQLAPDSTWGNKAQQYANRILNAQSVDDLKQLRTMAQAEARNAADDNEIRVLDYIAKRLEALEGATIKRAATSQAANEAEGAKIGSQLVGDLRSARKEFRGLMEPVGQIGKDAGLKRSRSIKDFVRTIEEIPSEQLGDRLFKTNNVKALSLLKKEFPTSFDLIRKQKIADIVGKASLKGEIQPGKLVKVLKALTPESRAVLFDSPDINKSIDAIETILNVLPDKIGPSGTPQGMMAMQMADLPFQGRELLRFGQYKTLQNPSLPISKVINAADKATIPFRRAGQADVGTLRDLIRGAATIKAGGNAERSLSELLKNKSPLKP